MPLKMSSLPSFNQVQTLALDFFWALESRLTPSTALAAVVLIAYLSGRRS